MDTPRAVIFDLDGTLAESKQPLTPRVAALLVRLFETTAVAVMSGGSWPQFQTQFLPAFGARDFANLYIFPDSGAQCYIWQNGAWHAAYDLQFSGDEKAQILQALDEALKESGFVQPAQLWGEQVEDRGAEITFSALGQQAPIEEKKKWDEDKTKRMPLYTLLVQKLPEFSVAVNATTSIDITRKGTNKAYGVRRLAEMLGVPVTDMVYVGDALGTGGNDAVVIETGVPTHAVSGPSDTEKFIREILHI
jgi:phosphomannomutase